MRYETIRKYVEEVIVDYDVRDEIFNGGDAIDYEVEIQSISRFIEKHDINDLMVPVLASHISVAFNVNDKYDEMAKKIIDTLKIIKEYVKER